MPSTLLKKRLWHRCFFCVFCKISKNTFLTEHLWRLLLLIHQKKCIVAGWPVVEGVFSFLFYCENGINQYALQKTLTHDFAASLLLLELGCLRYVVLPYHLRMFLHVFYENITSFKSNSFFIILFCTVYERQHIFKYKTKKTTAHCSFFL